MNTSPEPQTQPPQAPQPPQPPFAPADAPPLASFGARLLAHLIDLLFLIMAFFLLGTAWGALRGGLTDEGFEINGLSAVVPMGLTLLAFLAYLVLFESALAATPGKFIVGLRVREVSGRRCTFGQAARRNLLRIADLPTFYLVALFTKNKQRLGDLAARTCVVRAATGPVARVGAGLFLVAGLAATVAGCHYARRHAQVAIPSLALTNLRYADSESTPARASAQFKPGEQMRLFYDVDGVASGDDSQIVLLIRGRVSAPDGSLVHEMKPAELRQKVSSKKARVVGHWFLDLTRDLPAGKYAVQVEVEDQVAHATQKASTEFTLAAAATAPPTDQTARPTEPPKTTTTQVTPDKTAAATASAILPEGIFGISRFRFADSEKAAPRAGTAFKLQEKVQMYYEVPGFVRASDGKMAVVTHNRVLAPDGQLFDGPRDIRVARTVGDNPGPVTCNWSFPLPSWSPPGNYTVKIEAEDLIAHKINLATFAFTVNGPPVQRSATFTARDIELAESSDGPASRGTFTANQKIWLRFRIAGMKAGDKGRIRVTADWSVIGPDGKPALDQPNREFVNDTFVYLPAFYPQKLYVSLPGDAAPGAYRFKVVLHDKIAGADFTFERAFTVKPR